MKVSVIIPIYNVEPYITECLDSVIAQTMTEGVECILVDDCGTDSSVSIANKWLKDRGYTYSDAITLTSTLSTITFKFLHHDKNCGLSAARNTGIKAAEGAYLYFLDSDDEIIPMCLELLWETVQIHHEVDIVQGSFFRDYKQRDIQNTFPLDFSDDKKYIKNFLLSFDGDKIKAQNRLIKKSIIIGNDLYFKEGIIHEDNHWTFFLAKIVSKMAFCNTRTYYHRYNPYSITGNRNLSKEINAYSTLIQEFCANIDPFLYGRQKELILTTLLFVRNNNLYRNISDYKYLESLFLKDDAFLQKLLFKLMISSKGKLQTYLLHLLVRIYKMQ